MNAHPSLSKRLVIYLVFVQIAAFLLTPLNALLVALTGIDRNMTMTANDWGEPRANELVLGSLIGSSDAGPSLRPTEALRDYAEANPDFRYAAFIADTGAPLPGSSPKLTTALATTDRIHIADMRFQIAGDNPDMVGHLRRRATPVGDLLVAVYGYHFHGADIFYILTAFLIDVNLIIVSPMIIAAALLAWLVVRRGLAPLRAAATEARRIDMTSIDQRIDDTGVPREALPFVRAMNQVLERLEKGIAVQRRFTANAAHELRTPVAIMCAHIDNSEDATFRHDMKRDARRIRAIVEQLLAAAKISSHDAALDDVIDLRELILDMVVDYMPLAIDNRKKIEVDSPSSPVIVRGDARALESAIANLIDNALRAEPENGTVLVRVRADASVEVVDHGEGVASEDRDNIFEPFWRKSEATPGTGLGLAITKEIVERHQGALSVGTTPDGGATFRIAFAPCRAGPETAGA
jgi:signal transduction histidine kinase